MVTKKNIPHAAIMGVEEYEDMLDRLDTLAEQIDPAFQKSLEKSMKEYEKGEVGSKKDILKILRAKA